MAGLSPQRPARWDGHRPQLLAALREHLALRGFSDDIAEPAADAAIDRVEARAKDIDSVVAYAKEVAFNEARRRSARRREMPVAEIASIAALRGAQAPHSGSDTVELLDLLARLPHRQAAVALQLSWGMKVSDIAREREVSPSTIRRDIADLRIALRPLWDRRPEPASPVPIGRAQTARRTPGGRAGELAHAVRSLGTRQGQVFDLHLRGLSPEASARALGIPASSVRSSLTYARKNLRERLGWSAETLQAAVREWAHTRPTAA